MQIRKRRVEKLLRLHHPVVHQVIDDLVDEGDLIRRELPAGEELVGRFLSRVHVQADHLAD